MGSYLEAVYVECTSGYENALTYLNGYKTSVENLEPMVGPPGVNHWPTQDQYFKGALFLNTLRHVIDNEIVGRITAASPDQAVRELVNLANSRGGEDNISLLLLAVTGEVAEIFPSPGDNLPQEPDITAMLERQNSEAGG